MEFNREDYGYRVKAIRKSLGLTMQEFGELIGGANRSVINNIEKGIRPASKWMDAIAKLGETSTLLLKHGSYEEVTERIVEHYVLDGQTFGREQELIEWAYSYHPAHEIDVLAKAVELKPSSFIKPIQSGNTSLPLSDFAQPLSQLYKLSVGHFPDANELNRYLTFVSQWIQMPPFEKKTFSMIQDQINRLNENQFYEKTEEDSEKEFLNIKLNVLNVLDGLYTQKRIEHQLIRKKDE